MKKNWKHPNLIIGLVSFLTLLLSVGFRANRMNAVGDTLLIGTFALGFIHWVWAVVDVLKDYFAHKSTEDRNIVWVVLVIIVPPVGGILYYAFQRNLPL